MTGQIRHPGIPQRLGRVGRSHEIEPDKIPDVTDGVGDEDGRGEDECEADTEGALPAGAEGVGDGGVSEGRDDAGEVAEGWVSVSLDEGVAARGHPEGHDVVGEHLDGEGVDWTIQ